MSFDLYFFINSILFGIGLAMDAFSVSLANGLNEPDMPLSRKLGISGVFAFFQTMMPLLGWFIVHSIAEVFEIFEQLIPWIALILLTFIGIKMIMEGFSGEEEQSRPLDGYAIILQGIATSIDALSVGFAIAHYRLVFAVSEALIIGIVTYIICVVGVNIGKTIGTKLSGKAGILGGVILILIGIEIFLGKFS